MNRLASLDFCECLFNFVNKYGVRGNQLRKLEYLPWMFTALFSGLGAVVFIYYPDVGFFAPLSIEVIGTVIGFVLAISVAELIKISDKYSREKNITKALLNEVTDIVSNVDSNSVVIITDMWDMAIASNDLCIFNLEKLLHFRQFYASAKIIHEMGSSLKDTWIKDDKEKLLILKSALTPVIETIRRRGKLLLKKYS